MYQAKNFIEKMIEIAYILSVPWESNLYYSSYRRAKTVNVFECRFIFQDKSLVVEALMFMSVSLPVPEIICHFQSVLLTVTVVDQFLQNKTPALYLLHHFFFRLMIILSFTCPKVLLLYKMDYLPPLLRFVIQSIQSQYTNFVINCLHNSNFCLS